MADYIAVILLKAFKRNKANAFINNYIKAFWTIFCIVLTE